MDGEENFDAKLRKRVVFSNFINNVLNNDPLILPAIYTLVHEINTHEKWAAALYGGRCWNYWLQRFSSSFTPIEQSSILVGNFDILIVTSDPLYDQTLVYQNIQQRVNEIFNMIKTAAGSKKITYLEDNVLAYRTIIKSSIARFVYYEPPRYTRSRVENELNEDKLIMYVDLGIDTTIKNISLFKDLFINSREKPPFLSLLGLFIFSMFLSRPRIEEKGVNIDDTRFYLYKRHLLPSLIATVHQADIQQLIIHVVFVLYPAVFDTNQIYYEQKRLDVFFKLLTNFNVLIQYDDGDILFKDFLARINSVILDTPVRIGMPSLRQLLNYAICGIHYYNDNVKCILSGGDVLRRYLDETIVATTNDIDAKVFYQTNILKYKTQVVAILHLLTHYLKLYKYFKVNAIYKFKIANIPFVFHIFSINQEFISSVRILPRFVKPLISMDIKLKYTIYPELRITNSNMTLSLFGELLLSPMDFAFWKKKNNR
jgi:hypothetical protein